MALVFDSLGYSRKLREGGIAQEQAEAMADAAREHIMLELVSKQDLVQETGALRAEIERLRQELHAEMGSLRQELRAEMESLGQGMQGEMGSFRQELRAEMESVGQGMQGELGSFRQELRAEMESLRQGMQGEMGSLRQGMNELGLRLTVRLGAMLAAGIAILAALERLA